MMLISASRCFEPLKCDCGPTNCQSGTNWINKCTPAGDSVVFDFASICLIPTTVDWYIRSTSKGLSSPRQDAPSGGDSSLIIFTRNKWCKVHNSKYFTSKGNEFRIQSWVDDYYWRIFEWVKPFWCWCLFLEVWRGNNQTTKTSENKPISIFYHGVSDITAKNLAGVGSLLPLNLWKCFWETDHKSQCTSLCVLVYLWLSRCVSGCHVAPSNSD